MGTDKATFSSNSQSWEAKIVATGVADFEGAAPVPPRRKQQAQPHPSSSSAGASGKDGKTLVKEEHNDAKVLNTDGESAYKRARMNGSAATNGGRAVENGSSSGAHSTDNAHTSANGSVLHGNGGGDDVDGNKRKRPAGDDDEIGSDLDDSDEDEMEGNIDADGNEDMILCLYDKVQRVRNKWKCVLKDGVASIDGRDYVFSKLSSELEW